MINYDLTRTLSSVHQELLSKYRSSALSVNDVAQELNVDLKDVELLITDGELCCKTIGNKKRIMINSLVGYMFNISSPTSPQYSEKHKVNDILKIILEKKKITCRKLNSYYWYNVMSKHIIRYFNNVYVEDLDEKFIRKFLSDISVNKNGKLMSHHFVKVISNLLKEILCYSVKEKYIQINPFEYIKKINYGKKTQSKNKILSAECINKLLAAAEHSNTYKPMIILLLYSGIRIGELLGLSWSDIDRDKSIIHIRNALSVEYDEDSEGNLVHKRYAIGDTKTVCSVRDIPVNNCVIKALDDWKDYMIKNSIYEKAVLRGNQDIIFLNKFGQLRSYQSLEKAFLRFLKDNGLGNEHVTFHMFRHTYASLLQDAGADINIIRELLGHTDIKTTANIYVKVNIEPEKRAVNLLSDQIDSIRQ